MNIYYCEGCSEIRAANTNIGKYKCRKCGGDVINLHITEALWDKKTPSEKKAIVREKKGINRMVLTMEEEFDRENFDFGGDNSGSCLDSVKEDIEKLTRETEAKKESGDEISNFADLFVPTDSDEDSTPAPSSPLISDDDDEEEADLSAFGIPPYNAFVSGGEESSVNVPLQDEGNIFEEVMDDIPFVSQTGEKEIQLDDIPKEEIKVEDKQEPQRSTEAGGHRVAGVILIIIGVLIIAAGAVLGISFMDVGVAFIYSISIQTLISWGVALVAGSMFIIGGVFANIIHSNK